LVTRNLPAGETAAGTGERRALRITGSCRAANGRVRAALARRPDAKQAHLGECACLAPGDRLPAGETAAGASNTIAIMALIVDIARIRFATARKAADAV
jgi:hypothetical protein